MCDHYIRRTDGSFMGDLYARPLWDAVELRKCARPGGVPYPSSAHTKKITRFCHQHERAFLEWCALLMVDYPGDDTTYELYGWRFFHSTRNSVGAIAEWTNDLERGQTEANDWPENDAALAGMWVAAYMESQINSLVREVLAALPADLAVALDKAQESGSIRNPSEVLAAYERNVQRVAALTADNPINVVMEPIMLQKPVLSAVPGEDHE